MRLYRNGYLQPFLPNEYLGPDAGYVHPVRYISWWGPSSLNYGGNVEVIPPHTHNDQEYPFGRIVIGGPEDPLTSSGLMDDQQLDFFNAQEVQAPVLVVPSDWLYVGHIDEIFLVVPNPNADPDEDERPWSIVIASPSLAIEALEEASESGYGDAKVFEGRGYRYFGGDYETTVDDLLLDSDLMDFNDAVQGIIDTVYEKLKTEIGLADEDFREIPVLYEDLSGWATALSPGMQNLVVADSVLFVPDPEGPHVNDVDVWQQDTRDALKDLGLAINFVDVFYSYHVLFGEAHCGTNVERQGVTETPWWTVSEP